MLTSALLACIVALLFYKLVERRHKILLAKGLVGIALVVGLLVAAMIWSDKRDERERRGRELAAEMAKWTALKVTYMPESTVRGDLGAIARISFGVCNTTKADTVDAFEIRAVTWEAGHSDRVTVAPPTTVGFTTVRDSLYSDKVLTPGQCGVATFTRPYGASYVIRDSVDADATARLR